MNTERPFRLTAERKLALAAAGIGCVIASLAFVGGLSSWQYYLTVAECQADAATLVGKRVRVNGTVAPGSLTIEPGRASAAFTLAGSGDGLGVVCPGPLPDNLAEGIQVVVEGRLLDARRFRGDRVLTQCASKYQSRSGTTATATATAAPRGEGRPG